MSCASGSGFFMTYRVLSTWEVARCVAPLSNPPDSLPLFSNDVPGTKVAGKGVQIVDHPA